MMLLYNLYLFLTQKEKVYLYYVLYASFSLLFTMETSGYGVHFPSWLLKITDIAPTFPPALSSSFAMMFTLELFKNKLPKALKYAMYIFISLMVGDTLMGVFGLKGEAFLFIQPVSLFFIIINITAGLSALRKDASSAKFFLAGFGGYGIFFTYFVLCTAGVFTRSMLSFQALNLGLTLEVIMLSFALGDKMKASIVEKEKAQAESLKQSQENERLVREQNTTLEQKVKERTAEVVQQKHVIEEKHKEITDSINYAERIQRSFLATKELLNENLKEHFVLFKPKDIVSGDFYWAAPLKNGNFVLATADSTGHGVPGAIMSILNISSLEQAVGMGLNSPSEILNQTRKTIIERLKKDGSAEGGKDGMDASLICFDFANNKFSYAAANNPVLLVRENQIIELIPDKMPVGKHDKDNIPFTEHEVELKSGDVIYTLTDGLPDQFGGLKGKKFMYKQLKEMLLSIVNEPMPTQKQKLESAFENWKGELEQVDDVCVIGVRI